MNPVPADWDQIWTSHQVMSHHDTVIRQIRGLGVRHILEVGAGSGRDLERLHDLGCAVTYTDFSREAGRGFRGRCPEVPAIQVDARRLPFPDRSFELVYSLGLLEHFERDVRSSIIAESFRVASRYVLVDVPQLVAPAWLIKKAMMAVGRWPYGWETEYSLRGLVREVSSVEVGAEVAASYGRELFPLPRNLKDKIYRSLPEAVRQAYLKTHEWFAIGWAGSLGVVFKVPAVRDKPTVAHELEAA